MFSFINKSKLFRSISIVVSFGMIAKILSFFIEMLTAFKIGATIESDAYYVIYSIYSIISPMISIGIWKVYMPAYKERCVLGQKDNANKITNQLFIIFEIISLIIFIVINCFPTFIISLFAPGFNEKTIEFAVPMLRIISLLFAIGIAHTFSSAILQSHNQFKKSQFKLIMEHIPTLLYLLFWGKKLSVLGLTISVVVGELLTAFIMYILGFKLYSFSFPKTLIDSETKAILKSVPAACLNSIINQLNNVIDKAFASTLTVGAITCLNYGTKLRNFVDGLFSTAISTAVFPTITELAVKKEDEKLQKFVANYLSILSFFLIGLTSYICIYSEELVQILFGHGKFDIQSVKITSYVFLTYGLGLLAMCFTTIINDLFYIYKKSDVLMYTSIVNILLNIALNFIFIKYLNVAGLSLATSFSLYLTLFIKMKYIQKYIYIQKNIYINIVSLVISAFVSAISCYYINGFISSVLYRTIIGTIVFPSIFLIIELSINKYYRILILKFITRDNFKKGKYNYL